MESVSEDNREFRKIIANLEVFRATRVRATSRLLSAPSAILQGRRRYVPSRINGNNVPRGNDAGDATKR